ncbi:hypothetical protein P692DRAFT_20200214 [Suillus brevipes Sb2]|nr:hypothetical protein P692DRAFT_20200214 [Suillus brevipes Sb2]
MRLVYRSGLGECTRVYRCTFDIKRCTADELNCQEVVCALDERRRCRCGLPPTNCYCHWALGGFATPGVLAAKLSHVTWPHLQVSLTLRVVFKYFKLPSSLGRQLATPKLCLDLGSVLAWLTSLGVCSLSFSRPLLHRTFGFSTSLSSLPMAFLGARSGCCASAVCSLCIREWDVAATNSHSTRCQAHSLCLCPRTIMA